ncbi:MAG: tetratricopeptide repeat protein, partial [Mesorhizobium sp.]|nr:tetratricopeptide repeat protein [Mesorhizobium sp.]
MDQQVKQALALHQSGRLADAEALDRRVLAQQASQVAAQHFLGLLLHQTGRSAGVALVARSIKGAPNNPDFLNNYGTLLRDIGNLDAAAEAFRKAIAERPDHLGARDNLGSIQRQLGQFDASEETFRKTISLHPFHMRARIGLAETLQEAGQLDAAIDVFSEALSIRPKDADLLYGLGVCLMEKGQIAKALARFRAALSVQPTLAKAWLMLSRVKQQENADAELAAMQALHQRSGADSVERMQLSFGLGKAHDDLKIYDKAFDFFTEGNALHRKRVNYDKARTRADFEAMKAAFDTEFFTEHKPSAVRDETPIFIVGMPRSGTTLVEQIIASHPEVRGAGELSILKLAVGGNFPLD